MLPMVLAAVISAVRSVWFVDPVTGYDNGTMPRLWWTVAVLLCAVTTALLYRADRPPGRPAGKRTGGCFGVAGALCLVGGGALLAHPPVDPGPLPNAMRLAAGVSGLASGLVLALLCWRLIHGRDVHGLAGLMLAVPLFSVLRAFYLFTSSLLNPSDVVRTLTLFSALAAGYAVVRVFSRLAPGEPEGTTRGTTAATALALCLCVALALPVTPHLLSRSASGPALAFAAWADAAVSLALTVPNGEASPKKGE